VAASVTQSSQAPFTESRGLGLRIASFVQPLSFTTRAELQRISLRMIPAPPLSPDSAYAAANFGGETGFVSLENTFDAGMLALSEAIGEYEESNAA